MISLLALALLASIDPTSEAALVQQAKEAAAPVVRPTHVARPIPGDTLSAMGSALDELDTLWPLRFHVENKEAIDRVLRAEALYDKLPDPVEAAIKRSLPVVRRVLDASHAEKVRLPRENTAFTSTHDGPRVSSLQRAVIIATLAGWGAVEVREGTPLSICIDSLGVLRDLSYGDLLARGQANHGVHSLTAMCLAALTQQEVTQADCDALGTVEQGFAPFSRTLQQEKLFVELSSFASGISDETRDALPEEARAILGQNKPTSRMERFRRWLSGDRGRKDFVSKMDGLIAAADRPVAEADAAFGPFLLDGDHQTLAAFIMDLRQARHATTELRALRMACELRVGRAKGEWPKITPLIDARTEKPMRVAIVNSHEAIVIADADTPRDAKQIALDLTLRESGGPQAAPAKP